jgi:Predicted integral membrane protein (DUF2269)
MTLSDLLQFLHVVSAFMFVTGIVGRDIILGRARRAGDVGKVKDLVETAAPFERFFAIPGSFLVLLFGILTWWAQDIPVWDEGTRWVTVSLIVFLTNVPLIPLIFIPRGKVFDAALVSAVPSGRITSELSAALRDPAVAMARWWEVGTIAVVLLLMVTKPF